MSMKPPQFLADLYRDFRDRGLMLPAGLLVAALIAVPVLLSESPAPPPPAPQTDGIEATAATPAVLAEQTGLRNYRERLDQLKRKNPFDQQFTGPTAGEILEHAFRELEAGGLGGLGDPGGLDASVDVGGGEPPDGPGGGGDPPDHSGSPPTSDGPKPGEQPKPPGTEERWFTWEVDVAFGPLKATERFEGVRPMEFLPERRDAVAVMAGVGLRGNRAGFMFLPRVIGSEGDGKCAPGPQNCVFLMLKKGEQHRVTTVTPGEGEVTYRIRLLDIVRAELEAGDFESPDPGE